ncbi:MAG: cytochrome c oxidase accessory protein CcoG [Ignavibacteria bacterium]|nr:cytochrome c oxidase accessory protein CcoG [Ignavibacteria bacterium]
MAIVELDVLEDHERFRSELSSILPDGRRRWIYARKPSGIYYTARTILSVVLVAFLLLAPFIKIGGHQFLLLNILSREFVFFGVPFWPNDFYLVALIFLAVIVTIVLFTATLGRIWCGWLCPQTIFMEMVFRKIEWMIEGGPKEQAKRHSGPWTWDRIWRTSVKVGIFFAISFIIANTFLSYVISSDTLLLYVREGPFSHASLFVGLLFFTFVFFMVFYRFREQACVVACPYGRYMSALVDETTVAVTYDYMRGEQRAKWSKADNAARKSMHGTDGEFRRPHGRGDCVDCYQCVTVCPTGIDIRNGIQLECVNCTACIDACDEVMTRVGLPKGLVRYSSQQQIEQHTTSWLTGRIKAYLIVWTLLMVAAITLFAMRSTLDVGILRQEGTTWVTTATGMGNFYRLQIINKSNKDLPYVLNVVEPAGAVITPIDLPKVVHGGQIMKGRFLVTIPTDIATSFDKKLVLSIQSNGEIVKTVTTSFVMP